MQKFELGFAYRGTKSPEVKQVVEASSMRQAMLDVVDRHGGKDVVLVTYAHYYREPERLQSCAKYGPLASQDAPFMLAL